MYCTESGSHSVPLAHFQRSTVAQLFVECFSGAPWFETWTNAEAQQYLDAIYRESGFIGVVLVTDEAESVDQVETSGTLASFALGFPLAQYRDREEIARFRVSSEAFYLAEVGTNTNLRKNGYATRAVSQFIERVGSSGFNSIVSRTRVDNTEMIQLFRRLHFQEVGRYFATTGGVQSERVVFERTLGE